MSFQASQLKALTGNAAFERGERYFAQKRVQIAQSDASSVAGVVVGSGTYRCKLSWKKSLAFDCTCPVGDSGDCCKHIVALALAYEMQQQGYQPVNHNPLEAFLKAQTPAWLQQTLLDLAEQHPEIARQLNRQRQLSGEIDLSELKKMVTSIIGRPRFLDYRQSRNYAVKLQELGELLQQLLQANQAGACLQLAEFALPKLFKVYESSDDSSGFIGGEIGNITDYWLQACSQAAPLNAEFAKRLFKLSLEDQWGYVDTEQIYAWLSPQAKEVWDSTLEAEWAKLVANKPTDDYDSHAYKIKSLVEAKAKATGDVDRLIAIYSATLNAHNYHQLVEVCTKYQRPREAVLWAERGFKAHPHDAALGNTLVALYLQDGLEAEALQMQWQIFTNNPSQHSYLKLRELSANQWPTWRSQALSKLIASESVHQQYRYHPSQRGSQNARPNASTRIACLLAEHAFNQNVLAEVREILKTHTCGDALGLSYARLSAAQYPQESAQIIQSIVAMQVSLANNDAYAFAVKLLTEIQALISPAEFNAYIAQLKITHKAKRNFMALLNAAF